MINVVLASGGLLRPTQGIGSTLEIAAFDCDHVARIEFARRARNGSRALWNEAG